MPLVRLPTLGKAGYGDQLPAGAYRGRDGSTCSRTASCGANWSVMARATCFEVDLLRGAASVRTSGSGRRQRHKR